MLILFYCMIAAWKQPGLSEHEVFLQAVLARNVCDQFGSVLHLL